MKIFCIYCKNQIQNGYCIDCETTVVSIQLIENEPLKNTLNYKKLFNTIKEKCNLNKEILNNLLNFDLITDICDIKIDKDSNKVHHYFIKNKIVFKRNYKKRESYIYSSFPLYNKDFEVRDKSIYLENCIFHKNLEKIIFDIKKNNLSEDYYLYLLIKFNKNELIPYDINLLNKEEEIKLTKLINFQKLNLSLNVSVDRNYLLFFININKEKDIISIQKKIESEIIEIYDFFENKKNEYKENNKSIFERALLENEIISF